MTAGAQRFEQPVDGVTTDRVEHDVNVADRAVKSTVRKSAGVDGWGITGLVLTSIPPNRAEIESVLAPLLLPGIAALCLIGLRSRAGGLFRRLRQLIVAVTLLISGVMVRNPALLDNQWAYESTVRASKAHAGIAGA